MINLYKFNKYLKTFNLNEMQTISIIMQDIEMTYTLNYIGLFQIINGEIEFIKTDFIEKTDINKLMSKHLSNIIFQNNHVCRKIFNDGIYTSLDLVKYSNIDIHNQTVITNDYKSQLYIDNLFGNL